MRLIRTLGLIALLSTLVLQATAQTVFCPTNVDLESGNFNNWRLYTGTCCPINTPTLSGVVATRHTITSGSSLDLYGNFPIVAPDAGLYSLKLGNNGTGSQAERARYYVRVPSGLNNYSLFLRYAVVLEDGGHDASEQPRFEVKGYDSITNVPLPCVQFNFVASSSLPGFTTSTVNTDVRYKAWSTASINLSGYAGRTVALDFASGDCDQGGHFGYGYIDLNCGLFQISSTVCKGTTSSILTAPPGFQFYEWYDSTFTTLVGSARTITVPTPATTNKYYVILKPYTGFGCTDTLVTQISVSDLSLTVNQDTIVCNNVSVQLRDTATASASFQPLIYQWTPATALSCSNCLNPIASPAKTTRYTLKVTDATGCVLTDSFDMIVKLYITTQPVDVIQCKGSNAMFSVTPGGLGPFAYQWYKNGVPIAGAENDTLALPAINDMDTANYMVVVKGQCDSIISSTAKLRIHIIPQITLQPQNMLQCLGTKAVFKTHSYATTSLTYQWFRKGVLLAGANKDSLVINSITNNDTGAYVLKVQGLCDSVRTDTVFLRLQPQTTIITQPAGISRCKGTRGVFKVVASGLGTLTYQWRKNTVVIAGATKDSLVIDSIKNTDLGNYTVTITGGCNSVTSAIANLTIPVAPAFAIQPASVIRCRNTKIVFKAASTATLGYQWLKNGVAIAGATKDSLVFQLADFSDTANYTLQAFGICDTVLSSIAKLSLYSIPVINVQPTGTTQCIRTSYTLKAYVTNSNPMQFQWWKNGKKVTGATKDSLFISSLATTDSGSYFLVAKGQCDSVISDTVQIGIRYVSIIGQPVSVTNCLTEDILFKVKAYSTDTISYQWKMNGVGILNEIYDSLVVKHIGYGDTAKYTVSLTTACDTAASAQAKLSIYAPTTITISPQNTVQCHYTTAILRTGATGAGSVSYRWYKNGVMMPGHTADTLMVSQISYADTSDLYTVLVKSFCDSTWTTPAHIGVFPIPDPGLPDSTLLCVNVGFIETNGFVQYQWNTGSIANRVPIFTDGSYSVKVVDVNLCPNSDTTYVKLKALPVLHAGPDTVLCNEIALQLSGSASNYDSVKWSPNASGIFNYPDSLNPVFMPNVGEEGPRTLTITAWNSCGITTDELQLTLKKRTSSEFTPEDTLVCEGSRPIKLTPVNPGGMFSATYLTNDSFNPMMHGLYVTTYTISEFGCTDSSKQLIRVVPMPVSSFVFKSKQLTIDSAIVFIATSSKTLRYIWNFGNGDSSTTDTSIYRYPYEGSYRVILTSVNEICADTFVKDFIIEGSNFIWVPNVFTPDGDGVNDVFKPIYINHKGGVVNIYNRWGERVYTNTNLTVGWDGTFEGKHCVSDVYVYVVDYLTNEDEVKKLTGNITLLR